jgi:hypothetical protein
MFHRSRGHASAYADLAATMPVLSATILRRGIGFKEKLPPEILFPLVLGGEA